MSIYLANLVPSEYRNVGGTLFSHIVWWGWLFWVIKTMYHRRCGTKLSTNTLESIPNARHDGLWDAMLLSLYWFISTKPTQIKNINATLSVSFPSANLDPHVSMVGRYDRHLLFRSLLPPKKNILFKHSNTKQLLQWHQEASSFLRTQATLYFLSNKPYLHHRDCISILSYPHLPLSTSILELHISSVSA